MKAHYKLFLSLAIGLLLLDVRMMRWWIWLNIR